MVTRFCEVEPDHRHFSPCMGLHPRHQYSPLTNATLAQTAECLFQHCLSSGGASTGWFRIWASNLYARLLDGDSALQHANVLMTDYMYDNMWAVTSDVFQAGVNYGITSAVNRCSFNLAMELFTLALLCRQAGCSREASRAGKLGAVSWWMRHENGQIVSATVKSNSGGPLSLRVQDGRSFKVDGNAHSGPISTVADSSYSMSS